MLPENQRKQIISLINREVVTAIGCTEPIAVALCTAKAKEILGCEPRSLEVLLSANILKNAMGVGIPGTGMIGLPIAVALGATIGKSAYDLEVLKDVTPEAVEFAKKIIDRNAIHIGLKAGDCGKLYIEVIAADAEGNTAKAIISGGHTNFVYLADNENVILDTQTCCHTDDSADSVNLSMRTVWEFAM